jgi:hypothetical protein
MPSANPCAASVNTDVHTSSAAEAKMNAATHECRGRLSNSAARNSAASTALLPRLRSAAPVPTSWAADRRFCRTSRRRATRVAWGRS